MREILEGPPADVTFWSVIRGYVDALPEGQEYVSERVLEKCRWDFFWALSEVRRTGLLFYPFEPNGVCLLVNDLYGSVAGILCERLARVDCPCSPVGASLLERRYPSRQNLHPIVCGTRCSGPGVAGPRFTGPGCSAGGPSASAGQNGVGAFYCGPSDGPHASDGRLQLEGRGSYDYAFANLEYDAGNFQRYAMTALRGVKAGGTVLFSLRRDLFPALVDFLRARGLPYRCWDSYGNGMLLLEAGRLVAADLLDWSAFRDADSRYGRPPLLASRWVRKNDVPFFWEDFSCDQDADRIRAVKAVELDLLKKLLSVCGKHGLTVYPMYGTMLGAAREGGIIDGDDDIDVALPREDYDRLLSLSGEFSGRYFLQTPQNDSCFYGGYAKLRDRETTAIVPQNWWADCCEGIGIDIFPLDRACRDPKAEKRRLKTIRFHQRMLYASCYGFFKEFRDMPMLKWKAHKYLGRLYPKDRQLAGLDRALRMGDSNTELAIYVHYRDGSLAAPAYYRAEDFRDCVMVQFDGLSLRLPGGWERILAVRYGWGFGARAGFDEYKRRHGFYDPCRPYGLWKERFGGLKNPGGIGQPVILFGDGSLFAACLSYYQSRVNIPFLVLLPGEQREMDPDTGRERNAVQGIPVLTFDEFREKALPRESWRGVICSGDALAADRLLSQNGLGGLYLFWHNRDWMLYANQTAVWKDVRSLAF
ncbi:MAG: LicD family protein [Treponema sp.]|nr:LicD family protein [Treponema sp.]